jgi:ubiquinone biosynthesis protein
MSNPLSSGVRLVAAGWVLVRYDALAPREFAAFLPAPARWLAAFLRLFSGPEARRGRPGERLARAFERLGPVSVKLGQLLATRADIFGVEFAEDLSRLKDRLPPFPHDLATAEIERALGKPSSAVFVQVGEAVAAASIAQAHRAALKDGRSVAVKVLRPKVERRVAGDVGAMRLGATIVEAMAAPLRRLEPKAFVATVARSLELELDLRLEAAAVHELGEIMARDPYMKAPKVVWEGVGKRVLTLEWAQGLPMSDPAALEQPGLDRKMLADNVIRGFLAQALDHGAFHADLHEGNLFCSAPAEITAVDFGIVGRIGPKERRYLAEILWGFLKRDYHRVAKVHFEAGYVPKEHSVEVFAQALRAVGEPVFGRPAREVSMGRLLAQLFEITGLFDMRLRPELVLLQKTMVTVEGVARRIDPDHDIWEAAAPVVERWMMRELSSPKRLAEAARGLLEVLHGLARIAEAATEPAPPPQPRPSRAGRWALGIAILALAIALAALAWVLRIAPVPFDAGNVWGG